MSTPIPLPGQHRPGGHDGEPSALPNAIKAEVSALLDQLGSGSDAIGDTFDTEALSRDAGLLDRAHEVLVRALATVDKS